MSGSAAPARNLTAGADRLNARLIGCCREPGLAHELSRWGDGKGSPAGGAKGPCALYVEALCASSMQRLGAAAEAVGARVHAAADGGPRKALVVADRGSLQSISARLRSTDAELAEAIAQALVAGDRHRFSLALPRGRSLTIEGFALVMGVLNFTPDSFSDGGRYNDQAQAVAHVRRMIDEGADIIDVGAESTRPGADSVAPEEQIRRVGPLIREIRGISDIPVSIDASSARVAECALDEGADIVNDVTALRGDRGMASCVAERGVPVILMHMQGTPRTMQQSPHYEDVMADVTRFLRQAMGHAVRHGVDEEQILIDPGFGFGKTLKHNLELLHRLHEFGSLGRPVVVGTSRKSMIGTVLDRPVDQRLMGTAATVAASIARGAHVVRVHDVAEMRDVVQMTQAIEREAE